MGFLDKAKDLLSKNTDKVDAAIEKVGDVVDTKTGDKYKGASTRCRRPRRRPSTARRPIR